MVTTDYELFSKDQLKIFRKNARKGYHFFRPDTVATPTPRSAREAWGGVYKPDVSDKSKRWYDKFYKRRGASSYWWKEVE